MFIAPKISDPVDDREKLDLLKQMLKAFEYGYRVK